MATTPRRPRLTLGWLALVSLALTTTAHASETCPSLQQRAEAWTRRLASSHSDTRQRAQEALVRLGPNAIPPLLRVLNQVADANLRRAVVQTLGQIEDPRATASLTRVALGREADETLATRRDAVLALGRLRGAAGAPALATILDANELPLRAAAHQAVLDLTGTPAIPLLIRLLRRDGDMRQRLAIRDRLQKLSGEVLPADERIWQRWWDDHEDLLD